MTRIIFAQMTTEDLRRRFPDFSIWVEHRRQVRHLVLGFVRCTVSGDTMVRYREVPAHPSDFDFVRPAHVFLAEHRALESKDPHDG